MKNLALSFSGWYCLAFAAFHLTFWKIFRWKADLRQLTPVNRAITQVLNLRLAYVLLFVGIALLLFQNDLLATGLGRFILVAMSLFWIMRAVEQIIFFDRSSTISWVLVLIFLLGGGLFVIPAF